MLTIEYNIRTIPEGEKLPGCYTGKYLSKYTVVGMYNMIHTRLSMRSRGLFNQLIIIPTYLFTNPPRPQGLHLAHLASLADYRLCMLNSFPVSGSFVSIFMIGQPSSVQVYMRLIL